MSQLIHFVDDYDFKCLLLLLIQLLATGNLFDQLLDDNSVVLLGFTGSDFDVVKRLEDNALTARRRSVAYLVLFGLTL